MSSIICHRFDDDWLKFAVKRRLERAQRQHVVIDVDENWPTSPGRRPAVGVWPNPVAILNDLRPDAVYELTRGGDNGVGIRPAVMTAAVTVDGRTFTGIGRTKKSAKSRAAVEVLRRVFQLHHII